VGQRGRIKFQTIAHSPTGFAVEAGFLDELEAMLHEERHVVSNFLGNNDMRIEVGPPSQLAARDTLILASDGLTDNLHVVEIVETIRKGTLETAVEKLVAMVRKRMLEGDPGLPSKPDDLTVLLLRRMAQPRKSPVRVAEKARRNKDSTPAA
jgi:serine/threonine protein phosphatase PrpC